MEKASKKAKILSVILTISIITLLIIIGPAQALTLSLNAFSNSNPIKGDIITTQASIDVRADERIQFNNITLTLNGDDYCSFLVNGTILSGCNGMTISLVSSNTSNGYGYGYQYGYNYGYGYQSGYSNGEFKYEISLNTSSLADGTYDIKLKTSLNTHNYSSSTQTITISSPSQSGSGTTYSFPRNQTNSTQTNNSNGDRTNSTEQPLNETFSSDEETQGRAGITGAVIGTLQKPAIAGIIIFMILVLIVGSFVIIRKRRLKTEAQIEQMY